MDKISEIVHIVQNKIPDQSFNLFLNKGIVANANKGKTKISRIRLISAINELGRLKFRQISLKICV